MVSNILRSCINLAVTFTVLNVLICSHSFAELLVDLDSSISWSVIGNPVEQWKNQIGDQYHAKTVRGAVSYRSSFSSSIGLSGVDFSGGCNQMNIMTPEEADRLLDFSDGTGGFAVMVAFTDNAGADLHSDWATVIGNIGFVNAFFIRYSENNNMLSLALKRGNQIGAIIDGDSVVVGLNYDADTGVYTAMMMTSSGATNTVSGMVPATDFSTHGGLDLGNSENFCMEGMISKVLIYDNELSPTDFVDGMKKLEQAWVVPRQKLGLSLQRQRDIEKRQPLGMQSPAKLLVDLDATISDSVAGMPYKWMDLSGNQFDATIAKGSVRYPSSFSSTTGLSGVDFSGGNNQMDIMTSMESKRLLDFSDGTGGFCTIVAFTDSPDLDTQPTWATVIGNSTKGFGGFFLRYDETFGGFYFSLNGGYQIGLIEDGDSVVVGLNYDAETGLFTSIIISSSGGAKTIKGMVPAQDFSTENALSIGNAMKKRRYLEGMIGKVLIYDNELSDADFSNEMKKIAQDWVDRKTKSSGPISL